MNELKVTGNQEFMGKDIPVVLGGFGEGKKCISDNTIAEIHSMPVTEVRKSVGRNIQRFRESVDLIDLKDVHQTHNIVGDEITNNLGYTKMQISKAEHIYILSERGYAKLIKIMDTDLAWEIHDKLIDEYFQMREGQKQLTQAEILLQSAQILNQHEKKLNVIDNRMDRLEYDIPLYGSEAGEISNHVKRKGVSVLGGKKSNAYKDSGLRQKVYTDIYGQLKREFGVYEEGSSASYKALKRKYIKEAHRFIEAYEPPFHIDEMVQDANLQMNLNY